MSELLQRNMPLNSVPINCSVRKLTRGYPIHNKRLEAALLAGTETTAYRATGFLATTTTQSHLGLLLGSVLPRWKHVCMLVGGSFLIVGGKIQEQDGDIRAAG